MVQNKVSLNVDVDSTGAVNKIKGVSGAFSSMEKNVKTETGRIGSHFDGVGDRIARRFQRKDIKTLGSSISNSIMALFTGGSLEEVAGQAGLLMAVSLSTQFVVGAAERIAGSAAVQALIGALAPIGAALVTAATGIGTTIGTVIPTMAAIAMAIWPALLVAAIVAGIVFLVNHPEIVKGITDFVADMLAKLGKGLEVLGKFLSDIFTTAFTTLSGIVTTLVKPIVDTVLGIVQAAKDALYWLGLLERETYRIPTQAPRPHTTPADTRTGYATGGWAGLKGPELAMLGERGPEYVRKAGTGTGDGGGGGHGHPLYLDGRLVGEAMDERQYRLQRRVPTTVRA